ncbi:MAG TPA: ribonuclease Z [Lachnospiraceae bacterium]|nr:ribonuclease Z [Lachnospiraceae bacterium]
MLDLCLLGTGGMMPLPGRWLTALMARLGGSSLLVDCGEGTQIAIKEKGWSVNPLDTICFTHYHGDHISGLPGLLLSMGNSDRTKPVTLIGPKGLQKVVESLLVIAPGLPFKIEFIELSRKEEDIEVNGYNIRAFKVNHNIICYGYTINVPRGGRFYPERAKENKVPIKLWSRLQKGESIEHEGRMYTPDMVIGPARKGIKVTYCTDTRPAQSLIENAQNADLLICEGMYGEDSKIDKAAEYKHMTFSEAAKVAKDANVKEMWLTHYSPSLLRPGDYIKEVKKVFPNAYAAKDCKSVTLEFPEET